MESDPLLLWLQRRSPPPWQTTPVPQSAFSVSSEASSWSSSSSASSAFIDDPPQSVLMSPRSQPASPTQPPHSSHSSDSSQSWHSAQSSQSWHAFPPEPRAAQVHDATLRRLTGEEAPPSWFRRAPAERIATIERRWGPWRTSRMDLSTEAESRLSYRDRALTADEQRVARPREISQARFQRGWLPVMRRVWAHRLAAEKKEDRPQRHQGHGGQPQKPTPHKAHKTQKPPALPPRPTRDVSPVGLPPPQITHRYPLPQCRENHRSCCRQEKNTACQFCSQDGVKRAVLDNLI